METNLTDQRKIVEHLDREFADLIHNLAELVKSVPEQFLYRRPPVATIGQNILRSAAAVEQTCGGLVANLWDDPFEWTLPETLSTASLIVEYLSEVDATRQSAFSSISDDTALLRYISLPSLKPRQLLPLLLDTLVLASEYHGRALATFKIIADVGAQGFII
jgi:hypothetical protein